MSVLLMAAFCLSVDDEPLLVVKTVAEAAKLNADSKRVMVVMRDYETLETVFQRVPKLRWLEIRHPGHEMSRKSFTLLAKFKKLEELHLNGDPRMNDKKFAALGKLHRLKSLHLALPCPNFSDVRLASLGGLVSLKKLNMAGCRGNQVENEKKVWAAIKAGRMKRAKKKNK